LSPRTRALAWPALAAVVTAVGASFAIAASNHVDHKALSIVVLTGVAAAWIATGLYASARRPNNRTGALMTWTGFAWLISGFATLNAPALFTLALLVCNLYLAAFVHLLLAYPEGRIRRTTDLRLVIATYALAMFGPVPILLSGEAACDGCPESAIAIAGGTTLGTVGDVLTGLAAVLLALALIVVLARRYRAASGPRRRTLAPLLWSGILLLVLVAGTLGAQTISGEQVPGVLSGTGQIVFAAVPFAFLIGLLQGRMAHAGAVSELLVKLGEARSTDGLRCLLAEALDDDSLQLLYWVENSWATRDGRPAEVPPIGDRKRAFTPVEIEGERIGAIVHDTSLLSEPEALSSVAAAASLAMRGERLEAALRRSRARIVEAGLKERRRLERNLHDGAQQRLVALSLTLRIAQNQIAKSPEKAAEMVGAAQEELTRALEDLRELARGIHPAVLSDRGLQAAVEALAVRSPLPVKLTEVPEERLPEQVEAAAYFVIAEALTNVAKYANASNATVAVRRVNGHAEVEVRDDGVGGADPGRGTGIRGLVDRVGALDGTLALDSPPGSGTTLRAEIPV
jgi:signal transduction histidine kinase